MHLVWTKNYIPDWCTIASNCSHLTFEHACSLQITRHIFWWSFKVIRSILQKLALEVHAFESFLRVTSSSAYDFFSRSKFYTFDLLYIHVSIRIPLMFDKRTWNFTSCDSNFPCQLLIHFKCPMESQLCNLGIHDFALISFTDTWDCTTVCQAS